jgi:hypothetical protein
MLPHDCQQMASQFAAPSWLVLNAKPPHVAARSQAYFTCKSQACQDMKKCFQKSPAWTGTDPKGTVTSLQALQAATSGSLTRVGLNMQSWTVTQQVLQWLRRTLNTVTSLSALMILAMCCATTHRRACWSAGRCWTSNATPWQFPVCNPLHFSLERGLAEPPDNPPKSCALVVSNSNCANG